MRKGGNEGEVFNDYEDQFMDGHDEVAWLFPLISFL